MIPDDVYERAGEQMAVLFVASDPHDEAAAAWSVDPRLRQIVELVYQAGREAATRDIFDMFSKLGGGQTTKTGCCDFHNHHCEPPSELCCDRCTEAAHDTFPIRHADGSICVLTTNGRTD